MYPYPHPHIPPTMTPNDIPPYNSLPGPTTRPHRLYAPHTTPHTPAHYTATPSFSPSPISSRHHTTTPAQARIALPICDTRNLYSICITTTMPPSKQALSCITSLTSNLLHFVSKPCRRVVFVLRRRHRRHRRLYAVFFVFPFMHQWTSCCTHTFPAGMQFIVHRSTLTSPPIHQSPIATCILAVKSTLFMFIRHLDP